MHVKLEQSKNHFFLLKFSILAGLLSLVFLGCSGSEFSSEGCGDGDDCDVGGLSYFWEEGDWSTCDVACGGGVQTRTVVCKDTEGNTSADGRCPGQKPETSQICNAQACTKDYNWLIEDWGSCSESCGGGERQRNVTCKDEDGLTVADNRCDSPKPDTTATCNTQPCADHFTWKMSDWSQCSKSCGNGTQARTVECVDQSDQVVSDSKCLGTRPAEERLCNTHSCGATYSWYTGDWGTCSKSCGGGKQTRAVACLRNDGQFVDSTHCTDTKPVGSKSCNTQACGPSCSSVKSINANVEATSHLLDILVVVDDSGSMAADNLKLAQKLKGFTDDLKNRCNITDWRMCITTTDVGYYKGRAIMWQSHGSHILKSGTPNLYKVFVDTIKWIGHGWSSDEQGIKAMNMAVRENVNSNCFRKNAALSVIMISDEDERSVGGNSSLSKLQYKPLGNDNYPSSFVKTVKQTFGSNKKFNVNSIIVKNSQCMAKQDAQGADSKSFYGTKYRELSQLTGGGVGSICASDYTNNLRLFANKITHTMSSIQLQCRPIRAPEVNITPSPSNQSYNVVDDELIFTPVIKGPASIKGSYCCAQ